MAVSGSGAPDPASRSRIRRLRALTEQLTGGEPAAILPLVLSVTDEVVAVDWLCVHLVSPGRDGGGPRLLCSAAAGVPPHLLGSLASLPLEAGGGPPGLAAAGDRVVVAEQMRGDPRWASSPERLATLPGSLWSVPVTGATGVVGTISGYTGSGAPAPDQLEEVGLYAGFLAAAVERERLLSEAGRSDRVLGSLRSVLDSLAGPHPAQDGLALALLALARGLHADAIGLYRPDGKHSELSSGGHRTVPSALACGRQRSAAAAVGRSAQDGVRRVGGDMLAAPIEAPEGRAVVTAWWADDDAPSEDAFELFGDAARSLRLALEHEALERAKAEAASLRRTQHLQHEFLSRLNHELRAPLTAVRGYASTLLQPDVSWDEASRQRFLGAIESESARMGRLLGDLLDFGAIDSGGLRLMPDWCDVRLILDAACRCVSASTAPPLEITTGPDLPMVWADHDRLEQVFVNLVDNAGRHASGLTRVSLDARTDAGGRSVTVRVADDGVGIPAGIRERMFLPHERGPTTASGAGLGLAIARAIVDAHGGTIALEPAATGTTVAVVLPVEPRHLAVHDVDPHRDGERVFADRRPG